MPPLWQLAARFDFAGVLGPIGSEFCVVDLQVFLDVAVMKNEVVARAGFKNFAARVAKPIRQSTSRFC
jgi:uncharacterized linocin/CFP29 family protein